MSNFQQSRDAQDTIVSDDSTLLLKRIQARLPAVSVERVAREVVQRLALRIPSGPIVSEWPDTTVIDEFCRLILSSNDTAGEEFVTAARQEGATVDVVYHGYLAGAARELGKMWDEDVISFAQVAVGSSRLYRIVRMLRRDFVQAHNADDEKVFLALTPHETHTLGVEMAADVLRRDGWRVGVGLGETHDDLVAHAEEYAPRVIVVVANSERTLEHLLRLVLSLRIVQPSAYIIVAGNLVGDVADLVDLLGADGALTDIQTASDALRILIS